MFQNIDNVDFINNLIGTMEMEVIEAIIRISNIKVYIVG